MRSAYWAWNLLNYHRFQPQVEPGMNDPLHAAASRLGIPTHSSAGPGHGPAGRPIWAHWPRSPMEIARDALEEVLQHDRTAGVIPTGVPNRWLAYSSGWSCEGDFVAAVASLALHFSARAELRELQRAGAARRRGALGPW